MGKVYGKRLGPVERVFRNVLDRWRVGRGDTVRFWENQWLDGGTLREQFPKIYIIAQQKGVNICDYHTREIGEGREWHVLVSRNLNNWENGE